MRHLDMFSVHSNMATANPTEPPLPVDGIVGEAARRIHEDYKRRAPAGLAEPRESEIYGTLALTKRQKKWPVVRVQADCLYAMSRYPPLQAYDATAATTGGAANLHMGSFTYPYKCTHPSTQGDQHAWCALCSYIADGQCQGDSACCTMARRTMTKTQQSKRAKAHKQKMTVFPNTTVRWWDCQKLLAPWVMTQPDATAEYNRQATTTYKKYLREHSFRYPLGARPTISELVEIVWANSGQGQQGDPGQKQLNDQWSQIGYAPVHQRYRAQLLRYAHSIFCSSHEQYHTGMVDHDQRDYVKRQLAIRLYNSAYRISTVDEYAKAVGEASTLGLEFHDDDTARLQILENSGGTDGMGRYPATGTALYSEIDRTVHVVLPHYAQDRPRTHTTADFSSPRGPRTTYSGLDESSQQGAVGEEIDEDTDEETTPTRSAPVMNSLPADTPAGTVTATATNPDQLSTYLPGIEIFSKEDDEGETERPAHTEQLVPTLKTKGDVNENYQPDDAPMPVLKNERHFGDVVTTSRTQLPLAARRRYEAEHHPTPHDGAKVFKIDDEYSVLDEWAAQSTQPTPKVAKTTAAGPVEESTRESGTIIVRRRRTHRSSVTTGAANSSSRRPRARSPADETDERGRKRRCRSRSRSRSRQPRQRTRWDNSPKRDTGTPRPDAGKVQQAEQRRQGKFCTTSVKKGDAGHQHAPSQKTDKHSRPSTSKATEPSRSSTSGKHQTSAKGSTSDQKHKEKPEQTTTKTEGSTTKILAEMKKDLAVSSEKEAKKRARIRTEKVEAEQRAEKQKQTRDLYARENAARQKQEEEDQIKAAAAKKALDVADALLIAKAKETAWRRKEREDARQKEIEEAEIQQEAARTRAASEQQARLEVEEAQKAKDLEQSQREAQALTLAIEEREREVRREQEQAAADRQRELELDEQLRATEAAAAEEDDQTRASNAVMYLDNVRMMAEALNTEEPAGQEHEAMEGGDEDTASNVVREDDGVVQVSDEELEEERDRGSSHSEETSDSEVDMPADSERASSRCSQTSVRHPSEYEEDHEEDREVDSELEAGTDSEAEDGVKGMQLGAEDNSEALPDAQVPVGEQAMSAGTVHAEESATLEQATSAGAAEGEEPTPEANPFVVSSPPELAVDSGAARKPATTQTAVSQEVLNFTAQLLGLPPAAAGSSGALVSADSVALPSLPPWVGLSSSVPTGAHVEGWGGVDTSWTPDMPLQLTPPPRSAAVTKRMEEIVANLQYDAPPKKTNAQNVQPYIGTCEQHFLSNVLKRLALIDPGVAAVLRPCAFQQLSGVAAGEYVFHEELSHDQAVGLPESIIRLITLRRHEMTDWLLRRSHQGGIQTAPLAPSERLNLNTYAYAPSDPYLQMQAANYPAELHPTLGYRPTPGAATRFPVTDMELRSMELYARLNLSQLGTTTVLLSSLAREVAAIPDPTPGLLDTLKGLRMVHQDNTALAVEIFVQALMTRRGALIDHLLHRPSQERIFEFMTAAFTADTLF